MVDKAPEPESVLPTTEAITKMALDIDKETDRCLFVMSYLTAGRISEVMGITRGMISIKNITMQDGEEHTFFVVTRMPNRKNRKHHTKVVGAPIEHEEEMVRSILPYLKRLRNEQFIFPYKSRTTAWKVIKTINGLPKELRYPHGLRKIRLSRLVIDYGFDDQRLTKFAGWTNSTPADHYIQLEPSDLFEGFIKKRKE